jgi:glycosyltransferase involved in cell wall biosynthesis
MEGLGVKFLARSLESIESQTFTDYETIISDHSVGVEIEQLCSRFQKVRYIRNPNKRGNSSANLNNAIEHAKGAYIKIIFQDDFLSGSDSLARMIDELGNHSWLIHAYWHTDLLGDERLAPTTPYIPAKYESLLDYNSIGAPTAVLFKKNALKFDENLIWMMDSDFYFRLLKLFGLPLIISEPLAVQTLWPGQLTQKIDKSLKTFESKYVKRKHKGRIRYLLYLGRIVLARLQK